MNAVTKKEAPPPAVADYSASLLEVISKAARDPNVDIDKMERLLQMQERVSARQAEQEFAASFAQMQPNLPYISARNAIVHNGREIAKYADWPSIARAIAPILCDHGFGLNFSFENTADSVTVTARLKHIGGHTETNSVTLPSDKSGAKNQVQAVGSSLTYGQRYAGCPLVGVVIEGIDDDGHTAGGGAISDDQVAMLETLVQHTKSNVPKLLEACKCRATRLADLTPAEAVRCKDALDAKLARMAKEKSNG
jgi:hypothetical protein